MATISSILDSKNINLNSNIKLAQHRAKLEDRVNHILSLRTRQQVKINKITALLMDLVNSGNSFSDADHKLLTQTLKSLRTR